jgi:hypothetical protein
MKKYRVIYRDQKRSPSDTPRKWEVIEEVKEGETIDSKINRYLSIQNAGEMKSDRIKYVSHTKISG